jgi:hypothetical protein
MAVRDVFPAQQAVAFVPSGRVACIRLFVFLFPERFVESLWFRHILAVIEYEMC